MMLAASLGLLVEGFMEAAVPSELFPPSVRVAIGFWLGVLFIIVSKRLLDQHEDIKLLELDGECLPMTFD
jgi:zinc transporter ZupT